MHKIAAGLVTGTVLAASLNACKDISAKLPAGNVDPTFYKTPEAAAQMARNARYEFQVSSLEFMFDAGRIADEFFDSDSTERELGVYNDVIVLDQRHLPDETLERTKLSEEITKIKSYTALQRVRAVASLARRAVETYIPEPQPALRGELFVYEALAHIMLADLYCSGIPLSTVDFEGDYTYLPGSSTRQVYERAIVLLDSAITLVSNDQSILSLAQIAKGRALLALGQYEQAAMSVRDVPVGFKFELPVMVTWYGGKHARDPDGQNWFTNWQRGAIANRKGINGLPFESALDPRIRRRTYIGHPVVTDSSHVKVASHIEARLIQAEAMLHAGDPGFLDVLNTLRTDGTFTVTPTLDTVYKAGTGGVGGLAPLHDPANSIAPGQTLFNARLDLIMYERAFWLFFTGHRQGDLRRLLRNYNRTIEEVYPTGPARGGFGSFDQYVDVPIPDGERYNPYFTGCIGRGE